MFRHLLLGAVLATSCAATAVAAERSPSRLVAQPTVLTVGLAGECRASDDVVSRAQAEAARVWSRADVTIRWVDASEVPYGSPRSEWLVVRCDDAVAAPAPEEPVIAIAAIRFIGGRPTNTIALNVENANTLLRREARDPRDPRSRFQVYHQVGLGRMLGRAIAHEIGHFLTQSGAHTPTGLMRATHTVAALVGASLAPFKVG